MTAPLATSAAVRSLIHYSHKPLLRVKSVPISDQVAHHKPCGLWVSVEGPDDWKSWCEAESYDLDKFSHPHRVILSEKANILRLSTAKEIDALTRKYALPQRSGSRYNLDWKPVAESYDGIIIAPYVWERRLNGGADWYYSWDCASGCIWNGSAVKEIIPLNGAMPTATADLEATL